MLFVNEELEESQPVFSEPRKVLPKTDDEMVRRIKSMLGEYVHENELSVDESMELEAKGIALASQSVEVDSSTKSLDQKNCDENVPEDSAVVFNDFSSNSDEMTVDKKTNDQSESLNNNETTNQLIENSQNSSEASSITSRRCSLKRQCKERISLLDYNPMFTIRTKRAKVNPSNKGKSFENSDIPTLKKCPDMQLPDSLSEVPNQDPPPLLDSMISSYDYSSPSEKDSMNDASANVESSRYNSKSKEDSSYLFKKSSHQAQMKLKKQTKKRKKKKILYESLPVPEVSALSASAQVSNSVDAKIGSCQLKNGIIKIRLSKLPDNKKDLTAEKNYEVSFCESDALKKCKTLSVPLSPLDPDVYSAYCTSFKKKNHSSSKNKHAIKKKKGPEILPETEDNSSINSAQCMNLSALNSEKHVTDDNVNENTLYLNETENLEASKDSEEHFNEDIEANFTTKSTNSSILQSENTDIIPEKQATSEEQILTTSMENELNLRTSISQPETYNSKILCSINLSLINRLPEKIQESDNINCCFEEDKEEHLKNSNSCFQESNLVNSSAYYSSKKISSDIKKEMLTPPDCDLTRIELDEPDARHSPTGLQNDNKDDSCPNLTPAYPFEIINNEDTCKNSCENLSETQETALCSAATDLLFDHQDNHTAKVNASIFLHNSHVNKVKIEVPDAILANHERWNEFKEYKWCRDFTDVSYNGGLLFKEKLAYNVGNHGLWQDPELKKQYSSEYYLNEAKKLKHQADKEIDRMVQAMKYLEAVLYFILTGNAMEHSYIDTDRVHTMYKETLALIRFISSKFQKLHNASCRNIDNKLTVLSLRCQSLLYLKMYQLRRDEVRYLHRNITSFLKSENGAFPEQISPPHLQVSKQNMKHSQVSPSHQASPCSLTPSPAGSVASVSSQSSGYSSSELGWSSTNASNNFRAQTQLEAYSDAVTVSRNKYKMLQQQSAFLANLHLCHDLWEHADYLSSKEHSREFFLELDEECGCLSLHSPFSALVHYVRKGLYKLKDGT